MSGTRTTFTELSVGQVADRTGLSVSALHFYERNGLITSTRTPSNQRRYARGTLRRVAFIRASQRAGMPLTTIREALDSLPDKRTPTAGDWLKLSNVWREDLNERIAGLSALRDRLADCIGCGCLSMKKCQLVNPQDSLSANGPGAQRWRP